MENRFKRWKDGNLGVICNRECDNYTQACHFLELGWLSVALDAEGRK